MSGKHRAVQETNKARVGVAGALTAGALLLAPIGAVVAAPGIAHGSLPGVDPATLAVALAASNTPPPSAVHKKIIRLPGLKIEIKNVRGDHKPPKLKIVPFPGLPRR